MISHETVYAALAGLPVLSYRKECGLSELQVTIFDTILARSPEVLSLSAELAATGTEGARDAIVNNVVSIVTNMESHLLDKRAVSTPDEAFDYILRAYDCIQPWKIRFIWHFKNVSHEAGMHLGYGGRVTQGFTPDPGIGDDSVYWRGLAALHLSDVKKVSRYHKPKSQMFIHWAGSQGNIGEIITIAKQRRTLDIETLKFFLSEHRAINEGVL